MTMDSLNNSESTTANASALHGLYTDFDGWVLNFERCYKERSTYFIKETKESEENLDTAQNKTTIDKNSMGGLLVLQELLDSGLFKKYTKIDKWSAITNFNETNNFVNLDYVLLRLVKDSFLLQFTKSKL